MNKIRLLLFMIVTLAMNGFVLSVAAQKEKPIPPKVPESSARPSTAPATSWQKVHISPLHQFKPQEPRRVELPNGMVIFLQEDHELPLIDGTIRIRGGSREEPAEKVGMIALYADVWRTGGTKSKTGDELDDFLEAHAARVEASETADSTFLSWSSLKENYDQVFPVVLDLLENPEFRQDKLDLAKQQYASLISRRNDDLDDIAQRESTKLAYGRDNPYARTAEYSTIDAVTREDFLQWHKRTIGPANMILGIAGDFDSAAMEQKLRQAFGSMPPGEKFPPAQITFNPPKPGIYFIEKNDVNQSEIQMVDLGIDRRNPDYYAVSVMNELFGGGFSSRLFVNIRTKLGLAYSVGGGVGSAFDHPGITRFAMGTKSATTAAGIDALRKEMEKLTTGTVQPIELKKAKDAILNSFIFEFDSKQKVLAERMRYEFYGYPPDFLERYRAAIEKVTPTDVDRAARKYIHPEKMAVLVVGNAKEFDRDLSTFGPVTPIDISIPPPKKPGK
ncbi:MAG TPA: pitrilysin family protein [Candidatus Angelobacter sp.]|jgi:zinc protease|nr:pitrilysin family protein [Candidatus Angelobacter sp.]